MKKEKLVSIKLQQMEGDNLVDVIDFEVIDRKINVIEFGEGYTVLFGALSDDMIEGYIENLRHLYVVETVRESLKENVLVTYVIRAEEVSYNANGVLLKVNKENIREVKKQIIE